MATKKDLVEAYSFSRRRLVTAFVSGAPGGREVEPSRPGRTIVGGVALAVLLAAGAAIAGVFAPRTPEDWNQPGLVISKETGAAYVILESDPGELRPVINTTSAKLILGAESEPTLISQDTIDDQRIGEDIGILGAPASVPTSSLLINTGWTACTGHDHGIRTTVAETPDVVPAPGTGITVESDGELFVVAQAGVEDGARVFAVPQQRYRDVRQTDVLLASLDLPSQQDAVRVPREWINLFPVGAALDRSSFPVDELGQTPAAELPAGAEGATIGTLLHTDDDDYFLVTDSGPVQLTEFASQVYRNVLVEKGEVAEVLDVPSALGVDFGDNRFLAESGWPDTTPGALAGEPCAQLTASQGDAPLAQLVGAGSESAVGSLAAGDKDQVVDPGRGAYVLSGDWSGRATDTQPFLVDAKGRANPLVGSDAAGQLGYAEVEVPVVPDTWVELFGCGVNLSQSAALLPPDQETGSGCRED